MATQRVPQKIYISYARRDAPRIPALVGKLRSLGVIQPLDEVVSDKEIEPTHGALRDGVRQQIESASTVVIVWTPASAASQWVNYEIGLADALDKTIIPVVRRDDVSTLPVVLRELQAIVVNEGDG
jgi:hypothetical protein